MKLEFSEPERTYHSGSQTARTLTEAWVAESMYCPNCGNPRLSQFPANVPVADFFCPRCNDQYELKSQKKSFGKKVVNGAYETKINRLRSDSSPNLILMSYDLKASAVRSICVVPKRFFVPSIIEKRKPLAPTAQRAGWIGSNILLSKIPESGRIFFVQNGVVERKETVLIQWQKTAFLDKQPQSSRGWLVEVMNCVDQLGSNGFTLDEVYQFESHLSELYPGNNNVRPKIRQQLQFLRDNGYLEFLGNGRYRLAD
ncbi:MAG: hypothetical protein KDD62_09405 [Bdellovibrionales bacterium]|nr:hypothetical protein [Bdellovibrionales bacterium]